MEDDDKSTCRNVAVKYRLICILFYEKTVFPQMDMEMLAIFVRGMYRTQSQSVTVFDFASVLGWSFSVASWKIQDDRIVC